MVSSSSSLSFPVAQKQAARMPEREEQHMNHALIACATDMEWKPNAKCTLSSSEWVCALSLLNACRYVSLFCVLHICLSLWVVYLQSNSSRAKPKSNVSIPPTPSADDLWLARHWLLRQRQILTVASCASPSPWRSLTSTGTLYIPTGSSLAWVNVAAVSGKAHVRYMLLCDKSVDVWTTLWANPPLRCPFSISVHFNHSQHKLQFLYYIILRILQKINSMFYWKKNTIVQKQLHVLCLNQIPFAIFLK